jgi:hypothetical protein
MAWLLAAALVLAVAGGVLRELWWRREFFRRLDGERALLQEDLNSRWRQERQWTAAEMKRTSDQLAWWHRTALHAWDERDGAHEMVAIDLREAMVPAREAFEVLDGTSDAPASGETCMDVLREFFGRYA